MNDKRIREFFSKKYLKQFNSADVLLLNELGIINGTSIVDIAASTPKSIEGFEIKSAQDSLYRLPRQIKYYDKVFDFISIITEKDHLEECKKIIPLYWGIILAEENGDDVKFLEIRAPSINTNNDDYSMSLLLWKKEIIFELNKMGFKNISSERVFKLRKLLISIPGVNLREVIHRSFLNRIFWKTQINQN